MRIKGLYGGSFPRFIREGNKQSRRYLFHEGLWTLESWVSRLRGHLEEGHHHLPHSIFLRRSTEENGVWQMMVAASALHQRQDHDLEKLRMENNTLKQKIDGHYATSASRTGGALGKRQSEDEPQQDISNKTADDTWASFASELWCPLGTVTVFHSQTSTAKLPQPNLHSQTLVQCGALHKKY
jgi:hypothetical protein